MMYIYIALHFLNVIHVLSIVIQQTCEVIILFVAHFRYIFLHICFATHMYILVGVVSGSPCIYNNLSCLFSAFVVSCFPVRCICPNQTSMRTFFSLFCHISDMSQETVSTFCCDTCYI